MKNHVLMKVFGAIFLGIGAGWWAGTEAQVFGVAWVKIFDLVGQLFLNALNLVVVPLVVSSIIIGTARMGIGEGFGKVGLRTLFFFLLTSFIGVAIGLALTLTISPGTSFDRSAMQALSGLSSLDVAAAATGGVYEKMVQMLYRMIPTNIFAAAAQGQMLGLILFSMAFGLFIPRIDSELSKIMSGFWNAIFQIMMRITHMVMRVLPIGVFALIAKVTATTGVAAIKPVTLFLSTTLLGLAIFMFIALPLLLKLFSGRSPLQHFRHVAPALFTAFTTSSSAATLPITIECMEKRANVPNRICSFVLPLGTSINLAGSALYVVCAVIFIAQAFGLEMNAATLFTVGLMGVFAGFGMVAGIPAASLVTVVVILQSINLPAEGLALVLAVDRILDMCRTAVSVFCHTCCAAMVYKPQELA